jgi:hypothetical protein
MKRIKPKREFTLEEKIAMAAALGIRMVPLDIRTTADLAIAVGAVRLGSIVLDVDHAEHDEEGQAELRDRFGGE